MAFLFTRQYLLKYQCKIYDTLIKRLQVFFLNNFCFCRYNKARDIKAKLKGDNKCLKIIKVLQRNIAIVHSLLVDKISIILSVFWGIEVHYAVCEEFKRLHRRAHIKLTVLVLYLKEFAL